MSVRKNDGFTMIELMVTIAVVAIIAAFAVPSFKDMMTRNRINAISEEVANSLASARNAAITRRRTVVLVPGAAGWTVRLDSSAGQQLESHEVKAPLVISATTVAATPAAVTGITFLSTGLVQITPVALGLTLNLCDSESTTEIGKSISLSRIGRITSAKHANASTCNTALPSS